MTKSLLLLFVNPFSFVRLLFLIGLRSVALAILAWFQLVSAIVSFHVDLCWGILVCTVALISLPLRILTALQRERTLELHLHEMQLQLDTLVCQNKELEEQLQIVTRDRKVIETIFEEIEEEHEKALTRIDQLENELQYAKKENMRVLHEVQGKASSYGACGFKDRDKHEGLAVGSDSGLASWSTRGMILRMHGEPCSNDEKAKPQGGDVLKVVGSYPFHYLAKQLASRNLTLDEALEWRRIVALYRSVFSAMLSLLVAIIIWEAGDPCMPLVAALFTVVGMSLCSVVQFFSTVKNKAASDAIALLSINCFLLGNLTSPMLPSVVRLLAPRLVNFADGMVSWAAFSS